MTRSIACPGCGLEISIPARASEGSRIRCPRCSTLLPEAEDPDETVIQEIPRELLAMIRPKAPRNDETIAEMRALPDPAERAAIQPPRSLGGYRVGRQVDLIRAGALFRARRKSTGRELALAVMKPAWAAEPTFVARFAREAFAAGLLDHPNLIAPGDVDIARGFVFAASDALSGTPLSDPRGREGFDRSARVAAILHAARALRLSHEQGIYHRDLSLSKIRGDATGLVRLAELGVGLTPETPEVPAPAAIPVPGVLAPGPPPESPSGRFVRDDIAGLGRALQSLVGGERGDRALPPGLAEVIRRMLGEGPEPSYPDLGAVVRALEAELGVGGPFLPRLEESTELEAAVRAFEGAPLAGLRPWLPAGALGVLGLFMALAILLGKPLTALGALAFGAIVGASMVATRGWFGRDPIFDRVRELLLGGTRGDLLTVAAGLGLVAVSLAATGLLGFWIFLGLLAVGLASAVYFAVDRPIEQARLEPIARGTALVRGFRRQGVSEESIRRFVCRQGGSRWEEYFEALFGYEALRTARDRWGLDAGGGRRARFARWRDPIVDALRARLDGRRKARDLALFAAIEEQNLEARGINLMTARRRSRRIAEAIVTYARQSRTTEHDAFGVPLMEALNRVALHPDQFLTTAEPEEAAGPPPWREAAAAIARAAFGPRARFLLGAVLLAGCLLWMHQNALISAREIREATLGATADREKAVADAREIGRKIAANVKGVADASTGTKSLEVDGLSPTVTRRLDGFGLGVAGLILIASSFFRGARMAAFAVPGAVVAAIGPQLIEPGARSLGPTSLLALAIAAGLFGLGVFFGRTRE